LLRRTETVFPWTFAVARSRLPSPFKSPIAADVGRRPVAYLVALANEGTEVATDEAALGVSKAAA
jgi:hypothetical protein